MPDEAAEVGGIGLSAAISSIRADLLAARTSGEDADIRLPVSSVTVVLQVVATATNAGKAGFKVPIVNLELGGSVSREAATTSTVTVVFGAPVDRDGNVVKIAQRTHERKE